MTTDLEPARRSLGAVDTARADTDVLAAPATTAEAERAFNFSLIVSGIRCTLAYVVLPFVAPLIGLAPGVGPAIGIPVGLVALVANAVSIRRFHRVQHRWRWPVTVVHLAVIGLLVALVVDDLAAVL